MIPPGMAYVAVTGGRDVAEVQVQGYSLAMFCKAPRPPKSVALPDACQLLTLDDIQQVTSGVLHLTHQSHTTEQGIESAYCEYQSAPGSPAVPSLVTILVQRPGSRVWSAGPVLPDERPYSGIGDKARMTGSVDPPKPEFGIDVGTADASLDVLDEQRDLFLQVGVDGSSSSTDRLNAVSSYDQAMTKIAFVRLTGRTS
jgi:hypothetical protein